MKASLIKILKAGFVIAWVLSGNLSLAGGIKPAISRLALSYQLGSGKRADAIQAALTTTSASRCGAGSVTLTASSGTAGGTYIWYSAATGGTVLQNSSAATYTANFVATTTIYVSYTPSGGTESARAAVTATINPIVSSPISGLTFAYPFNGNASDVSGNVNTGVLQSSPTLSADRYGNASSAYTFNRASLQYISTTTQYNNPTSFSISLWFNTTTAGGKLIGFGAAKTGSSSQYDRHIYMSDAGQLYFGVYNGGYKYINTAASYNDGNWHHVVVTMGTTNGATLYVDGTLQASNSAITVPESTTGYWRIGYDNLGSWPSAPASSANYYYNGQIDDISIYKRELTAAEIASSNDLNLIGGSNPVCVNNPITLYAPAITGATYSWTDGTTTVAGQNATFPSANKGSYTLTVTNTSTGCNSSATVTPGGVSATWTGAAGTTNPTTTSNWQYTSSGTVVVNTPFDGATSIIIPANGSNIYPALTASQNVYNLTINSGASINLNGFTLSTGCNIYNSSGGQILYGGNTASGITWNGSGTVNAQSYNGSATAATAQLGSMTVNNALGGTVAINGGPVDIYNLLTITKGNLTVSASPAALTLKSTAALTASVPAIPSPYTITGTVNAERYFKAQSSGTTADNTRNYRLLSSPVANGSGYYNLAYLSNASGVFTGGPGGPANGFTVTNATPTVYIYKEDATASNATFNGGNFKGLTNIKGTANVAYYTDASAAATSTTTLYAGNGYMLYYCGSNTANTTAASALNKQSRYGGSFIAPDAAVITAAGTLNQGNIPVKIWNTGSTALSTAQTGYNLAGNPYACSIDWDTFTTTGTTGIIGANVSPTIYVFNYSSKNYGTYQAGLGSSGTNNGSHLIGSGQGFFVKSTGLGVSASLTFTESAKTTSQPVSTGLLFAAQHNINAPRQLMRLKLSKDTINTDDIIMLFEDGAQNTYEPNMDANRLTGIGNVATLASYASNSAVQLAINHLHSMDFTTRIKLYAGVSGPASIDTLTASGIESLDARYNVYLIDHYKKDSLLLSKYPKYLFNINPADTSSFGANRFELVFHKNSQAAGFRLLSFTGTPAGQGVQLSWKTEHEDKLTGFTLQRMNDSKQFLPIYQLQSNGRGTYTYLDKTPAAGTNLYRLLSNDAFGSNSYSNVVTITPAIGNNAEGVLFSVYPNPAASRIQITLNPQVTEPSAVTLQVKIIAASGRIISSFKSSGGTASSDISNLKPGTYIIEATDLAARKDYGRKTFIKF